MPEFAEAEIHRRNLNHWTQGRVLTQMAVLDPERVEGDVESLSGRRVLRWGRRAKYLFCSLEGGLHVLVHLGMSGNFAEYSGALPRFCRFAFYFSGDGAEATVQVALLDRRRFGRVWVLSDEELQRHPRLLALGPEPMGPGLSAGFLMRRLGRSRAAVHGRMLEQDIAAGVGNIAIIEACHIAGVHPRIPCNQMDSEAWWLLIFALRDHFEKLLSHPIGQPMVYISEGRPEPLFLCYGREGEACHRCASRIIREVHAGRPAFYCRVCQPLSGSSRVPG